MRLSEVFLQQARGARERLSGSTRDLELLLANLVTGARAAWPGLPVTPDAFAGYLGSHLPGGQEPKAALELMHASDLYLACGCLAGDAAALQFFDKDLLAPACSYFSGRNRTPGFDEELKQYLRTRLFVAEDGMASRIASYSGQAPIKVWLRTVASRAAVDLQREQKWIASFDGDDALDVQGPGGDPEIHYLKRLYRKELEEAFRTTLAALSSREGNFLRMHYLEGMTMESIAALFRVSRRTVHRCISAARRSIFAETRKILAERLRISTAELNTVMGLVQSQFDVSILEMLSDGKK